MKTRIKKFSFALSATLLLAMTIFMSMSANVGTAAAASTKKVMQKVTIQLKWLPQAQFAGIYVAEAKGFFKKEGIDPTIIPGGPDMVIEQQVMNGSADLGITSMDSLMVNIDHGLPLVSVAQILQKSSNILVVKKSSGITTPEQMKGKKIGTYGGSQQFQELAFLQKYGLHASDVNLVKQTPTMDQFLTGDIDVATGAIFNEYLILLESGLKAKDLRVFSFDRAGTGMLEDTLIANRSWLQQHRALAVKTVRAILEGWQYAIAHQNEATTIVMKNIEKGSTTRKHQAMMLQYIAPLIMPKGFKPNQIGSFNKAALQRTANIVYKFKEVSKPVVLSKVYDPTIQEQAMK